MSGTEISGASSVEALIPGNPAQIQQAIDTLSSGVDPARQIQTAWGSMQIPGWSGRAANAWKPFTPREAAYVGKTVTAMSMAAAALREYQTAFTLARAEAAAAILEAQAAEQATANAQTAYRDAVKKAADAKPGSPDAKTPIYTDPGAAPLANAQARLDAARTNLDTAGNTAAGIITTAGNMTSNVRPTITGAGHVKPTIKPVNVPTNPDMSRVLQAFKGFVFQGLEDLWGLIVLATPIPMIQQGVEAFELVLDPVKAEQERQERLKAWGDGTYVHALGNMFLAWDLWESNPPEAAGRVIFNVATLGIPVGKFAKFTKLGTAAKATKLEKLSLLLKNSKNVKITDGKVYVKGVEKMSLKDLEKLYKQSVHNMDAKQATLGKWKPDDPTSYERVAEDAGDAHFNLPEATWNETRDTYKVTGDDLYELLNKPFLEEIVEKNVPVRFTHDPTKADGALKSEFEFLEGKGYIFDEKTLTMIPPK